MELVSSTYPSGSTQTDADLAARLVQGDDRALAEVYRRHAPRVLAVANAVLGDQTAAEDVCQEVFVRLSRQLQSFDSRRGSLGTYLVVVAHGRALDRLRFEQAWAREQQRARFAPISTEDAGHQAGTSTRAAQIRAAVSALPVHEAQAVCLAYFGGTTYREVARILEVADETVKTRIRSGLTRLRAAFVEQGIIVAT